MHTATNNVLSFLKRETNKQMTLPEFFLKSFLQLHCKKNDTMNRVDRKSIAVAFFIINFRRRPQKHDNTSGQHRLKKRDEEEIF